MDRPSRKTKAVNYCEPTNNFHDDDDDFAFVTAPPSKKVREDVKQREHKKSSSRRPLDQKLYERDLEAAITLSLLNNPGEIKDQSPAIDENTDPASRHLSNCSVDGAVFGLDEITSETGSPASSRQRKASTVEQKQKLKEEDYQPKLTPDSESDEDFSEAEEFRVKKEKTKPSGSKKEKQPLKSSKSKSATATGSTPVRSPPAGGRIPKWNPPGKIGRSPTSIVSPAVKSPGQGLRLGLSRLVRVKPLHPSVASH